ncbi:MAG TPA: VCBS repeat-containing protein, partial [Jatrophihabitantaceae bacterium]|nr:VCBS repeat-containing protein [Jatrophihabitantaceae bacterium]
MRSRMGAVLAALATVVASAVVVTAQPQQAHAVSGTQFKAGNIISNKDFYNSTAMTIAQVQSFLNAEVPDCQSGYTCLPQYTTKTTSQPAKAGLCKAYTGQPKETAAQVIVHVAHACGINPQVLIVLLQKEQGLVTSTAPSSRAYAYATGANCPDTTGCDSASSGFFIQVYLAAYQFQYYKAHPDYYQYLAGATNNILYSPRKGCGSSPVYIQNEATASLYIYTPYQPNAAALANLYGTGDSCSSYGNRNFWVYFTTWFGPGTPDPTPTGSESPYGPGGLLVRDGSTMYDWTNTANTSAPYLPTVRTQLAGTWQGYDRIVAGDVDDDGQPDLIARKPDGTLWLFDNSGNATAPYGSPVQIGSGWQAYDTIAAADIDGDGFADVIARDASGQLYLYRNSQQATAPYPTGAPIGSGFGAYATLLLGDVNGDGYADLIAIKPDGTQWLFVNTQNPAAPFGSPVQLAGSSWDIYNPIVLVDIDGDGLVDLVARSSNGDLWLYVNTGNAAKPFTGGRTNIGTGWGTYDMFVGAQVPFPAGACQPQTAAPFTDVPL